MMRMPIFVLALFGTMVTLIGDRDQRHLCTEKLPFEAGLSIGEIDPLLT